MTVVLSWNEESESTTTATTWQTKLTIGSNAGGGVTPGPANYKIMVYFEMAGTLTNREISGQVVLDGTPRGGPYTFTPSVGDRYIPFFVFGVVVLDDTEDHTLLVQYRSEHSSQTAKIRRVRALVEKQ